jgi:hypothetical protein
MHTIKKFTYPMFMGICSILATFADILQNQNIFTAILVTLAALGVLAVIVPSAWVTTKLAETFGVDPSIKSALKPFGFSCLILGMMIYAFSAMSTEASPQGGALISAFPELKQLQVSLGKVAEDVGELKQQTVAIERNTEKLVASSVDWISVNASPMSYARFTNDGVGHHFPRGFIVELSNESGQAYEEIAVVVSDGSSKILSEKLPILLQNGFKRYSHERGNDVYEKIAVCVTGKRKGRDEWVIETRVYQLAQRRLQDHPDYDIIEAREHTASGEKPSCSI